jgi:hypothetical protein
LHQGAHRLLAELGERLAHRGQRRAGHRRDQRVVERHHRQLIRNRDAALPRGLKHAEGLRVAGGEDRGRPRVRAVQDLAGRRQPVGVVEVGGPHDRAIDRDPGLLERGAVPVQPRRARQRV